MPFKEKEIQKLYYSMKEVTEMFNVNASQIRFYEKEFDIIQPKKNNKGNRMFTPQDINNFKTIFNLVAEKGFTLKGAKDYLKNNMDAIKENQKIIHRLEEIKNFLKKLSDEM